MKLQCEIPIICDTLMLTEADLAKKLGVSLETINAWKEVKEEIEPANLEGTTDESCVRKKTGHRHP